MLKKTLMMKKLLVALVMAVAVAVGTTAVTGFAFVPEAQAFSFKKAVKKAGRGIKKTVNDVGHGRKKLSKSVLRGGRKLKKSVKGTAFRKVYKGVKKQAEYVAGRVIVETVCVGNKICKDSGPREKVGLSPFPKIRDNRARDHRG